MFYYLSQYLLKVSENTAWHEELSFLRLFRYISFRGAGAPPFLVLDTAGGALLRTAVV